jgi:hypothetical protein
MFDESSRYFNLKNLSYREVKMTETRIITYKERRFLPHPNDFTSLTEVQVAAGERLDTISSRTIGDPEQFWRICDANEAMHPIEMTSKPGKILIIGIPNL